jgi:hypothetical protein
MKIYLIDFKACDYDQYDAFIVRAKDEVAVEALLRKKYPESLYGSISWSEGFKITEVKKEGREEIILSSFNAG